MVNSHYEYDRQRNEVKVTLEDVTYDQSKLDEIFDRTKQDNTFVEFDFPLVGVNGEVEEGGNTIVLPVEKWKVTLDREPLEAIAPGQGFFTQSFQVSSDVPFGASTPNVETKAEYKKSLHISTVSGSVINAGSNQTLLVDITGSTTPDFHYDTATRLYDVTMNMQTENGDKYLLTFSPLVEANTKEPIPEATISGEIGTTDYDSIPASEFPATLDLTDTLGQVRKFNITKEQAKKLTEPFSDSSPVLLENGVTKVRVGGFTEAPQLIKDSETGKYQLIGHATKNTHGNDANTVDVEPAVDQTAYKGPEVDPQDPDGVISMDGKPIGHKNHFLPFSEPAAKLEAASKHVIIKDADTGATVAVFDGATISSFTSPEHFLEDLQRSYPTTGLDKYTVTSDAWKENAARGIPLPGPGFLDRITKENMSVTVLVHKKPEPVEDHTPKLDSGFNEDKAFLLYIDKVGASWLTTEDKAFFDKLIPYLKDDKLTYPGEPFDDQRVMEELREEIIPFHTQELEKDGPTLLLRYVYRSVQKGGDGSFTQGQLDELTKLLIENGKTGDFSPFYNKYQEMAHNLNLTHGGERSERYIELLTPNGWRAMPNGVDYDDRVPSVYLAPGANLLTSWFGVDKSDLTEKLLRGEKVSIPDLKEQPKEIQLIGPWIGHKSILPSFGKDLPNKPITVIEPLPGAKLLVDGKEQPIPGLVATPTEERIVNLYNRLTDTVNVSLAGEEGETTIPELVELRRQATEEVETLKRMLAKEEPVTDLDTVLQKGEALVKAIDTWHKVETSSVGTQTDPDPVLEEVKKKLAETEKKLEEANTKVSEVEGKLAQLTQEKAQLEKDKATTEDKLTEVTRQKDEAEKAKSQAENERSDAERELSATTGDKEAAERKLAEAKQKLSESESKIAELTKEKTQLEQDKATTESKLTEVEDKLTTSTREKEQLATEKGELEKQLTEVKAQLAEAQRKPVTSDANVGTDPVDTKDEGVGDDAVGTSEAGTNTDTPGTSEAGTDTSDLNSGTDASTDTSDLISHKDEGVGDNTATTEDWGTGDESVNPVNNVHPVATGDMQGGSKAPITSAKLNPLVNQANATAAATSAATTVDTNKVQGTAKAHATGRHLAYTGVAGEATFFASIISLLAGALAVITGKRRKQGK